MDPHSQDITALILAGGRGMRMGGLDKGLQPFRGQTLTWQVMARLQAQSLPPGNIVLNANRNLATYEAMGATVCPDTLEGYAGPLAGFLAGLQSCRTPLLLTVPCDTPLFPLDLCARLHAALIGQGVDIAMAAAPEEDGRIRPQPVFCLIRVSLLGSLRTFLQDGGRKIDAWTARHPCALVPFDRPLDAPQAFFNANTLEELNRLESL